MRVLALALALTACEKPGADEPGVVAPAVAPISLHPPSGQGVYGVARVYGGDFMPRLEGEGSRGVIHPATGRRVVAFRGVHAVVQHIDPRDPAIAGTAVVDAAGRYHIPVAAPGKYTVVLEDLDHNSPAGWIDEPYAELSGELDEQTGRPRTWAWLVIAHHVWTEHLLDDNRRATY